MHISRRSVSRTIKGQRTMQLLAASVLAGVMAQSANAAAIWKTAGGTTSWTTPGNWTGDPVADVATFNGSSYSSQPLIDGTTSTLGISITGAAAVTITSSTGTTLTVGGGGISLGTGTAASSVTASIILGANQTWTNAGANTFTLGSSTGAINNNGNTLALSSSGAGGMVLNYATGPTIISTVTGTGTGAFTINNTGSGSLSIIGAVSEAGGSLTINNSGGGAATFGSTLSLGAGALTVNGDVTLNGAAAYTGTTGLVSTALGIRSILQYAATSGTETLGTLTMTNKGGLAIQTANGSEALSFSGFGSHTVGSTGNLIIGAGSTIAIGSATTTTAISGGAYLTVGSGAGTAYVTTTSGAVSAFASGTVAASANDIGAVGTNYDMSLSGGTDTITTAARTGNTLRYSGSGETIATNGNLLTLNGVLNAGTGTLIFDGTGTNGVAIGLTNELVLNAANADIEFTGKYRYATSTAQFITTAGANKVMFNQIDNASTGTLTFNNGSSVAGAGQLVIGSSKILAFNLTSTGTIVVNNVIIDNGSGASGMSMIGTGGTVTLNNANTFSGSSSLGAGLVNASGAGIAGVSGPLGIGTVSINTGGKIRGTVANALLGPSSIQLNGGTLSGFGTATTVYGGDVSVLADSTVLNERASTSGGVNITFGTLAIGSSILTATNTSSSSSGTSTITFGATTLSGNPTFNVNKTGAAGMALAVGSVDNGGTSRTITLTGDGSLTMGALGGSGANYTFEIPTTSGGITINGSGTYSGVTTIDGGILSVTTLANAGSNSGIGTGVAGLASDLVLGNGTLRYSGSTAASTDRLFTIGDAGGSAATVDASGIGSGSISNWTNTGAIAFGTTGVHTLTFAGSLTTASTFAPLIADQDATTGKTSVTKTGAGAWSLTGANTYSGGTTVLQGTLQVAQLGGGDVSVSSGASLIAGDASISNNIALAGTLLVSPTAAVSSTITVTGLNARVSNDNTGSIATISGKITGSGGVNLSSPNIVNAGIAISNPDNDWSGDTTLDNHGTSGRTHTLRLDADEVIPNGMGKGNVVMKSLGGEATYVSQMLLNGHTETINGLIGGLEDGNGFKIVSNGGTVDATLKVGDANASGNFIGILQDGGAGKLNVVKIGSGTQVLARAATYSGMTTVTGGTLKVDFSQYSIASSNTPSDYFTANSDVTLNGATFAIQGRQNGGAISEDNVSFGTGNAYVDLTNADAAQLAPGQALTFTKVSGSGTPPSGLFMVDMEDLGTGKTRVYLTQRAGGGGNGVGNVSTVATNGKTSQALKSLTIDGAAGVNSTIDFGTSGDVLLTIDAAPVQVNDGSTLTIADWAGVAGQGGGTNQLLFKGLPTDFSSVFTQDEIIFGGYGAGYQLIYDGGPTYEVVAAGTAVPEPMSLAILGVGAVGLLAGRRRRR